MKVFEYESPEFKTVKEMNKYKKELMNELCDTLGVERGSFRLQQGNIVLHGLSNDVHVPLTSRISDFPEHIRLKGYESYKLKTRLGYN